MSLIRNDWTREEIKQLYQQPFADLIYQAQTIHRQNFDPNEVQISTLLSIKTGTCPEDCSYCSQSGHYQTSIEKQTLLSLEEVIAFAKKAKAQGATRFCMGAAWRSPPKKDFPKVIEMIKAVNALGLETCLTAGMLSNEQVDELEKAELGFYNHNLDTSPEHYPNISTTRTYQDRLDTLDRIDKSNIHVCCGGIMGMGETMDDRISFLFQLATREIHPFSVPINMLIPFDGTPLAQTPKINPIEFVRTVATARILMPKSYVRLSAGRNEMNDELQALCFIAGANSIHYGEKLLTSPLPDTKEDQALLDQLGIRPLIPNPSQTEETDVA